jgi:hypothetical protein
MDAIRSLEGALEHALASALRVDAGVVRADAAAVREAHPGEDRARLARRIFERQGWKAAVVGAATGLPANLLAALPAAVLDATAVLRCEVHAAATVATLYDERYLDRNPSPYELLVPIFGADLVSQTLRRMGLAATQRLTRRAIASLAEKEGVGALRRALAKAFGKSVVRRTASKAVPFVAAAVGGVWNLAEVRLVGRRVVAYFEDEYAAG